MTTREGQLRANKAWRDRTGLQLVQAWLPKGVVCRLDLMVRGTGASGRAAVLTKLIEGGAASAEADAHADRA